MKTLKKIFAIIFVFVLCFSSCANQTESVLSESEQSAETSSDSSVSSEEETVDPFADEDDIIDSENDIVIDIYDFIENCNAEHKESISNGFDDSSIKAWGPDFYENLGLVSEEEANALLNTPENNSYTTKEAAFKDVDLLFRVYPDNS